MTFVGENINSIISLEESSRDKSVNSIWRLTDLNYSPPIHLGKSLEPNTVDRRASTSVNPRENELPLKVKRDPTAPSRATLVIKFELPGPNAPQYVFHPKPIPTNNPAVKSSLASLIGPVQNLDVEVTLMPPTREQLPPVQLKLKIPQSSTFSQFISVAVKLYNRDAVSPLIETPEAYVVYLQDEEGAIQGGEIDHKKLVGNFSGCNFTIKENIQFSEGSGVKKEDIVLRIYLPTGNFHTLAVQPDRRVATVLSQVCERRKLEVAEYVLVWNGEPVRRDLTAEKITDKTLHILSRADIQKNEGEGGDIFWYGKLAQKYQRFTNISFIRKERPLGAKTKDCVLGIDGQQVTLTLNLKKGPKDYPPLNIADILSASFLDTSLPEKQGKQFVIHTRLTKSWFFEAPTKEVAKEIVGKLQYLHKEQSSNAH